MAKSAKIKSMTELTRSLAHSSRTEKNILEIKDKVSNYDYQMYCGKSFIDPTMTYQNYCLYNKVDEFNNLMD